MKRLTWLLVLALTVGCSGTKEDKGKTSARTTTEEDDDDHGPGPRGGLIVDIEKLMDSSGKKNLHMEFVVDHPKKEVRVYILDSKAKADYPIKAESAKLAIDKPKFSIDLKPEKVDANGKTTCFVGKDDRFGVEQEFAGTFTVVVDGKPYSQPFAEKPHQHEKK
jgi:hypothetical protein